MCHLFALVHFASHTGGGVTNTNTDGEEGGDRLKRLIFIGPHCSGKTTRARLTYQIMKATGLDVAFRREGVRLCPYPINEQGGYKSQKWILDFYWKRDVQYVSDAEFIVMDRCSLDTIPYTTYLYHHGKMSSNEYTELVDYAWRIYQRLSGERVIFYNEPLPLVGDGVRSVNVHFRDFVTQEFERLLTRINDPIVRLGGD